MSKIKTLYVSTVGRNLQLCIWVMHEHAYKNTSLEGSWVLCDCYVIGHREE